ncbi:sensor histidine kinase [Sulfitobacter marinus]|nr:HAMP domain-containing sensor histidine kinase [Sulfitobacter marinus]
MNATEQRSILKRLSDYAIVGQKLFWQRIIIYGAALGLAGFYYDHRVALFFLIAIGICEIYDTVLMRHILATAKSKTMKPRKLFYNLYAGTILSAITISSFCIAIAIQQGTGGGHFLPMFLLVSASIFATMNNHQFIPVLVSRLAIYVSALLYIAIRDVWIVRPPITSEIWLNLFTILFVLGFVLELARTFILGYSVLLKNRIALQIEHKNALAASEAKTRFLATVSHELRTPLTSIKGALDLIDVGSAGEVPPKMTRLLGIARSNSSRLIDLVGDLLLLQSSDAGKFTLNLEMVDMGSLVTANIHNFQPYAKTLNVEVDVDIPEGKFFVLGDKKRLGQVVMNLLSNAAKFSETGGVVRVALSTADENIVLSVADQGIGIPEGSETQIFEEFGQIDSSDQRKFQGTGLGLSISKRIVEGHGGSIEYDSELGTGTTFKVTLKSAG